MDKTLREVRNEFNAPRDVLLSKECEQASKFLSVIGDNNALDTVDIESAIRGHYDFSILNVKGSTYFFYRYSEEDGLQEMQHIQLYNGYEVADDDMINYVITFFRYTCSFGFALMSQDYDYLNGNDDKAEKQRLSFLKSNRDYLRAISVSDIDLSNHEEIPYLKPMASDGTSFGSRFMKKLNNLNKP
jgi:hypothetical protein